MKIVILGSGHAGVFCLGTFYSSVEKDKSGSKQILEWCWES